MRYRHKQGKIWNIQFGLHALLVFGVVSILVLCHHLHSTLTVIEPVTSECFIPNYDPFDLITRQFVRILPPHSCSQQPWLTRVEGGNLLLDKGLLVAMQETVINCSYQVIVRETDEVVTFSKPVLFLEVARPEADFVRADCFTKTRLGEERQYKAFHHVMREQEQLERTLQERFKSRFDNSSGSLTASYVRNHHEALGSVDGREPSKQLHSKTANGQNWLNFLIVGIDSVSRFSTIRLMPRLRHFLSEELHAIELTNFNKVGDNTFPNVLGLVSGRKVDEDLQDMLNSLGVVDKPSMDKQGIRFLWDDFHDEGYRTMYVEDSTGVGTFNWGKGSGFQNPPTHYYFRPMELAKEKHSGLFSDDFKCFAGFPNEVLLLNYTQDYSRLFKDKPHFSLTFIGASTHGNVNGPSQVDGYHEQFLRQLQGEGLLNNTLLIYFSDHGIRGLRSARGFMKTPLGKYEEMRPFMFLVFPPWFAKTYPHLLERVQMNSARLTTHFDVHATILDTLYLHRTDPYKGQRKFTHGISLFQEIPISRTCMDAGIPLEYCVCFKERPLSPRSSVAQEAGRTLIAALNAAQKNVTKCHTLSLQNVSEMMQIDGGGKYLDLICDGWLSDKSLYRITVLAQPGGGLFEGTLSKCSRFASFQLQGEVNRLNLYGKTSDCVRHDRILKKICFCKTL